jgi:V8-like Glu-specific endopeptidase
MQVSNIDYKSDTGQEMLLYTAQSLPGDCGQAIIDCDEVTVIGLHSGIDKSNKPAKRGYGLPFTTPVLTWIRKVLSDNKLGNL